MDIKWERRFQGLEIGGKYNVQLNTDGRNCFGSYDCRYKTSITGFSRLQNCMYVGDIKTATVRLSCGSNAFRARTAFYENRKVTPSQLHYLLVKIRLLFREGIPNRKTEPLDRVVFPN
jgi:hypothetical protein